MKDLWGPQPITSYPVPLAHGDTITRHNADGTLHSTGRVDHSHMCNSKAELITYLDKIKDRSP